MDENKTHCKKTSAIAVGVLLLCLYFSVQAHAVGIVSGHYLIRTATEFTLAVKTGAPTPVNLIIIQCLPPGTAPAAAKPPYKKYDAKKGEVRWLLRNVQAGTITVQLKLTVPVKPDQLKAEIRCMDPTTGKLVTTQVP